MKSLPKAGRVHKFKKISAPPSCIAEPTSRNDMATSKKFSKEAISARRDHLRAEHAEAVREKIQTTELVGVLQGFALGTSKVKMTGARLKAIEMLLDKTVPNLASVKHEVEAKSITFLIDTTFPDEQQQPSEVPPAG